MLVVPISRLPSIPGHRLTVTRTILDEAAQALGGEALRLSNGDFALLGVRDGAGPKLRQIATLLSRLWDMPADRFLIGGAAEPAEAAPITTAAAPATPAPQPGQLLARAATVELDGLGAAPRLLHMSWSLSPGGLLGLAPQGADAATLRHVGAGLEPGLLSELAQRPAPAHPPHLGLGLPALASAGFFRLVAAWQQPGARLGVELDMAEAALHPALFTAMRGALRARGILLAIGGIKADLLPLMAPEALEADTLRLDWSPALPPAAPRLAALLATLGPQRLVLAGVDEAGLRFGLGQGMCRFHGPRIASLLGGAPP